MSLIDKIRNSLAYSLSLPERTLRSLSAGIGGVSRLLTDSLLPLSLRETTFYRALLGNTQQFLIREMGGVKEARTEGEEALPEDFIARKMAGNVVDAAGIFAFHFSPLWFFALAGDVAGGTRTWLDRIVGELRKDGVIGEEEGIDSLDALLGALQGASEKSAMPFDAPPLSGKDIDQLRTEVSQGYRDLYAKAKGTLPDPESLWNRMMELREKEKIPLIRMAGTLSLKSTAAIGKATGALLHEKVLLSYADSLSTIGKEGFFPFFTRVSTPYLEALTGNFAPSRGTWTEKLLGKKKEN